MEEHICLIQLYFTKKYKKGKRGTQRVNLKKIMVFPKFRLFYKISNFTLFYPFYPFFDGDQKVTHFVYIPHKYHINRPNSKKVMGSWNLSDKKRQILYINRSGSTKLHDIYFMHECFWTTIYVQILLFFVTQILTSHSFFSILPIYMIFMGEKDKVCNFLTPTKKRVKRVKKG